MGIDRGSRALGAEGPKALRDIREVDIERKNSAVKAQRSVLVSHRLMRAP